MNARTLATLVVAVLAVAAPAQAAQDVARVDVHPDEAPTTDAPERIALDSHEAGERYAWTVNVTDDYAVVDLVVHDGFDVTRARQLVPLLDGSHFVELHRRNVTDVDQPAKVFNLTSIEDGWRYRLGLPGPGERNLTLHRDVQPPEVSIGPVRNVTHFSFDVKTRTSEPALADLVLEKPDGSTREQATPRPGLWQRFPVQGLDAETTYAFHVRVWDWSGNQARTADQTVTTAPAPNPPDPIVEPVSPMPDATVDGFDGVVVSASFQGNGSPVVVEGVQVFFDKERVDASQVAVQDGRVTHTVPGPLEPRAYSVSVEVPNEAGGTGVARWSFTVEGASQADSPLGGGLAVLALVGLAAILGRRHPR